MSPPPHTHTEKPVYGVRPKEPGMYLGFFHGRERPDAVMDGWGFDGPVCLTTITLAG